MEVLNLNKLIISKKKFFYLKDKGPTPGALVINSMKKPDAKMQPEGLK